MKARDLAALAALGIAGKYAYDKFGGKKKDDEPTKKKMGEGLDMTNQGAMVRATRSQSDAGDVEMGTKGAYLPETAELRTKGAYLDDTPEFRTKGAYLDERATPAAPVAVAKPVRKQEVESRSLDSVGGPARYNRAADSNAAGSAYDATAPVAQRIAALNAANGAASESARQTDALANTSRAAVMVDRANKINPTAMQASGASTPSAKMTDKLAVGSRANQAAYLARQRAAADALRSSGGRRAKGGVVKMASGGMTSSKMSKPSGASRGDGIAQRGKTRGTLR